MSMLKQIEKEQQLIARCQKSISLDKVKARKAQTKNKIELGGLVIKSGMNFYDKSIILGCLAHSRELIQGDQHYISHFKSLGDSLFTKKTLD